MSIYHLICSCVICKREITVQSLKSHHKKHQPKCFCTWCNSPIYKNQKFCSSSCAAKHNNRQRDYSTFKPGPKPGSRPKNVQPKNVQPAYTKVSQCVICQKYHPRNGVTCSSGCKNKHLSNLMKERIKQGFNPNANRGRSKRSYLELSFQDWIEQHDITDFEIEYPFKRHDVIKTYFADFYFPNKKLIIELDGTQHNTKSAREYDQNRDRYISTHFGVQVVRVSHKEYVSKSRINEIGALLGI